MGTPDSRLDPTDRQRSLFRKLQIRKWSSDTIEMVPGLIGAYQAYAGLLCAARKGDPTETTATARGDGEASLESAARRVVQELFACRCILTKQTRQIRSTRESIEDGGVSTLSGNEIQAVLHSTFARGFLCCPGIAEAIGPLHALLLEPAAQSCEKTSPNRSEGEMKQERPDDRAPTTEWGPDPPAWTWSRCQEQRLRSVAKPPPSRRFTVLDTARRPSRKQKQKLPASAAAAAPVDPMAELQRWRWWASSQRLCAERMRPHSERLRRQLVERMAEQEEARKRLMATRKNALQQHLRQLLLQTNPFADTTRRLAAANRTGHGLSRLSASESSLKSCREEKSVRRQKKDPGYIVNDPRLFFGHYY